MDLVSACSATPAYGLGFSTAFGLSDYHDEIMIREVILPYLDRQIATAEAKSGKG